MTHLAVLFRKVFLFYYDGFRTLSDWGRKVWLIIIVKVLIIFILLKLFFFHDFLKTNFKDDAERSNYVFEQLVRN